MSELTVWQRLASARESMILVRKGSMKIGGNKIDYSTIDDLYECISGALIKQDLWLNTPLVDNAVHVNVVDTLSGEILELLSYPCALTGRDTKADAGMWTSCKRYALTSAFNLAAGDESDAERDAEKQEERRARGFNRKSRYESVPDVKITRIRALLVEQGFTTGGEQRKQISKIINEPIEHLSDLNSEAQADKIIDVLSAGKPDFTLEASNEA